MDLRIGDIVSWTAEGYDVTNYRIADIQIGRFNDSSRCEIKYEWYDEDGTYCSTWANSYDIMIDALRDGEIILKERGYFGPSKLIKKLQIQ